MNEILNPQSYFSPRFDLPYKKRILYLADTRRQNAGNSTVQITSLYCRLVLAIIPLPCSTDSCTAMMS